MEGPLFVSAIAILVLGLALVVYGIPVGLCLWLVGRVFGRKTMLAFALAIALGLVWFGVASHLGCSDPTQCDSPGMILFGPIIYIVVPGWVALTAIMAHRVWRDLAR